MNGIMHLAETEAFPYLASFLGAAVIYLLYFL